MDNINKLVQLADEFDRLGHTDLANNVDRAIRLAADLKVDFEYSYDRPYNKEEEQRLIAIEYNALYKMLLTLLPKIDYLAPFIDTLVGALDHASLVIKAKMEDKTPAFNLENLKKRLARINIIQQKLQNWSSKDVTRTRVIMERDLLLQPFKQLLSRLQSLFKDDETLEAIADEFKIIINVFENIFGQTISQIADMHFPVT